MLLRFEAVHVHRQFRRSHHIGEENKFPAHELRAITKIEIFGKRVVLPAARFLDARTAPETGRPIKIKKASTSAARGLAMNSCGSNVPNASESFRLSDR